MAKILCDRQNFIDGANGDLLIREGVFITHLGDKASDALDAHERGETIHLTVKGVIVSKVKNYIETRELP